MDMLIFITALGSSASLPEEAVRTTCGAQPA